MKRFVLTGAPGCGKTSIINVLRARGFSVVEEAATTTIARSQANGVEEPWTRPEFIEEIALFQEAQLSEQPGPGVRIQFFDRSAICTYALAAYLGYPVPVGLKALVDRIRDEHIFESRVFFVENLGRIETTAVRRITYEQSLEFERVHEETYALFGYELVRVPRMTISERTQFMLDRATTREVLL